MTSTGLVTYKSYSTDFVATFTATYKYISDSLLLYQFWKGTANDTCIFKFDEDGRLLESIEYANDDHGRGILYKNFYEYSRSDQLIEKTVTRLVSLEKLKKLELAYGFNLSTKNKTIYHYTDNQLDSSSTTFFFPTNELKNYYSKTYYSERGLRKKTIEKDTLVSIYKYSERTN